MNKITQNLKLLVLLAGMFIGTNLHAQIGIGTTAPAGGSILDINSADKGILVPRVNITNLGNIAPVTGGATVGLLVWNTNGTTGVGYHYWSGSAWIPLLTGAIPNNNWSLTGNAIAAANFLGTTNNQSLNIRSNNANRMRVQNNGLVTVGFGAANATAGDQFSALGTYAVNGYSTTGIGVYGQATSGFGIAGDATTGSGAVGFATSGEGVYGDATTGIGVLGVASNAATGVAGRFDHTANNGHGLLVGGGNQGATTFAGAGLGISGTGRLIGILGRSTVAGDSNGILALGNGGLTTYTVAGGSAVSGTATNTGIYAFGTDINSTGMYGDGGFMGVNGLGFAGIVGDTYDLINGWGVFSNGDFGAAGVKYFNIDHPLDPANKYLKHANIESNEILNLYRGTEVFDGNGKAYVSLPDYYDAINMNPSYQLTPIGAAMPNLYIEKEVKNGQFIVAGGVPGKKVSWQLIAERNDAYMQKYPNKRIMEVDKGINRGKYLIPELYGQSKENSITRNGKTTSDPSLREKSTEAVPQQLAEDKVKLPDLNKRELIKKEKVKEDSNLREVEQ